MLAAKSALPLFRFVDDLDAATPARHDRGGTHGLRLFRRLRRPRDHNSTFSIWLSGLISDGTLTGNEPFLEGVALVARRPDNSVVDRPTPPHPAMAAWATPPDPRPQERPVHSLGCGRRRRPAWRERRRVAGFAWQSRPRRTTADPAVRVASHAPPVTRRADTDDPALARDGHDRERVAGRGDCPLGGRRRCPDGGARRRGMGRRSSRGRASERLMRKAAGTWRGPFGGRPSTCPAAYFLETPTWERFNDV